MNPEIIGHSSDPLTGASTFTLRFGMDDAARAAADLRDLPEVHETENDWRGETRQTAAMPKLARNSVARVEPKTIDEQERTVEVTWTTGSRVRRRGFLTQEFDEELSLDDSAVKLGRLNAGAPVLNSHEAFNLLNVVGVVERAWMQGSKGRREGRATLRFSERADVEPIWRDVQRGILRNISVGYEVSRWEKVERKDDVPLMRAVEWEPLELSLVPIPADAGAQVRAAGDSTLYPCVIVSPRGADMVEHASRPADEAGRYYTRTEPGGDRMGGGPVPPAQQPVEEPPKLKEGEVPPPPPPPPAGPNASINPVDAAVPTESSHGPVPNVEAEPKSGKPGAGAKGENSNDDQQAKRSYGMSPEAVQRAATEAAQRAVAAERARASAIIATAEKLKLDRAFAQQLIDQGVALDKAREAMIDARAARQDDTEVRNIDYRNGGAGGTAYAGATRVVDDHGPAKREAISNAILHRYSPGQYKLSELGRQYRSLDLHDMAREVLEENGVSTRGLNKTRVAEMALKPGYARLGGLHTTSDFASILSNVTNTTLRAGYDAAARTFTGWARRATVPDYRPVTRVQMSNMPELRRVREHGEYERGTITEGKETYSISKFGRIVGITAETIINDNLDAFTRIPEGFGNSAANLESDVVYSILLANAAMSDGTALFHVNRNNVGTAAALGMTPIGAAFTSMMKMTGLDGRTVLSIRPQFLLAPPELYTVAQQLLTAIAPAQTSNVVPQFIQALVPVIEPRLSAGVTVDDVAYAGSTSAYYLLASPGQVDTVEYAYLEGEEGVYTETRNGFDVDGVEVKARLNFAAKALDHRGIHRNVGL